MTRHPAKYSVPLLPRLAELVDGYERVLDPFAGTGERLHGAIPRAVGVEIEPEWARMTGGMVQGNALCLPFADGTIDAIVTSPTYGNRMADHHNARDASRRNTYTHAIGHKLHDDNSGAMHWGPRYRDFHGRAMREFYRVLRPGGRMVINMKDHIKNGERQNVCGWWKRTATVLGFDLVDVERVQLPGNRYGQNGHVRVLDEEIMVFEKGEA